MSQGEFPSTRNRFHHAYKVKDCFFLHFVMYNPDYDCVTHLDIRGLIYSHTKGKVLKLMQERVGS